MTTSSCESTSKLDQLKRLPTEQQEELIATLTEDELLSLLYDLEWTGRPKQQIPGGNWRVWVCLAGRGFGKTWMLAKVVNEWAKDDPNAHIAIVAETVADARDVIVLGPAGIVKQAHPKFMPDYEPSKRLITWPNGAKAHTYSAEEYDQLRGPSFSKAVCDELAKWQYQDEAWDNLQMCMRLGANPQVLVTTTPRPTRLIKELARDKSTRLTTGSTYENNKLPPTFFDQLKKRYEGTRLGQQELHAVILEDNPNALFKQIDIEAGRVHRLDDHDEPWIMQMDRIVVAIDPSTTSKDSSDECGIVVCGRRGDHGYVFDDLSKVASPNEWSEIAIKAYQTYEADKVIGESNNGGDMIATIIQNKNKFINYNKVTATRGKALRAEPIASLYEQHRVHHVGYFDKLEDQMCAFDPSLGRNQKSPDRLDACVYALTELFGNEIAEPRAYFL